MLRSAQENVVRGRRRRRKYQLVRFEGITNQEGRNPHALECDGYRDRPAYSYGCYPRERRRNQKFQSRPLDGVEVYFPTGANPG